MAHSCDHLRKHSQEKHKFQGNQGYKLRPWLKKPIKVNNLRVIFAIPSHVFIVYKYTFSSLMESTLNCILSNYSELANVLVF